MCRMCIIVFLFVLGIIKQNVKCETSSAIPAIITNCYRRNYTISARPPTSLPLLVELLRKIEIDERTPIDARVLATSMLHGVIFNGIRKNPSAGNDDNIIPYRATSREFYKYRILVDYLIPGQIELFPVDSLTQSELCFLHSIVSRTVDPHGRGDESSSCNDRSSMPIEPDDNAVMSNCPLQKGIVKSKWGPISSSQVLAALAGGMQMNEVTFSRLTELIEEEDKPITHKTITNENNINVVWVATLAGDVAASILNQITGDPTIGNRGFWNDTVLPRAFYLKSHTWDMTEADILGGIDGAIMGTYVNDWMKILDTIRLSQILDMYYSERGIPFGPAYKAGDRAAALESIWDTVNLKEQIIGAIGLLQAVGGSEATLSSSGIQEFVHQAMDKLKAIAGKIANQNDKIEYLGGKQMMAPIELIIILDGTYDYYTAQQMIYTLSEAIQVSHYRSKLGVINGQSGKWMVNVTRELFQIFANLNQQIDEWPDTLHLDKNLQTIMNYYDQKITTDCTDKALMPMAQAILVLSQDGRLNDNDIQNSKGIISAIKSSYPGTRIIYLTQNEEDNGLKQLLSIGDEIVPVSNDVLSFNTKVTDKLSQIPSTIIKHHCTNSEISFSDYITPGIDSFYEIHGEFIKRGTFNTKFSNDQYGDISVCAYKYGAKNSEAVCKNITTNNQITFDSNDFCIGDASCSLWFQVSGENSRIRCTESECRYPDQIRIDLSYTYSAASASTLPFTFLLVCLVVNILNFSC